MFYHRTIVTIFSKLTACSPVVTTSALALNKALLMHATFNTRPKCSKPNTRTSKFYDTARQQQNGVQDGICLIRQLSQKWQFMRHSQRKGPTCSPTTCAKLMHSRWRVEKLSMLETNGYSVWMFNPGATTEREASKAVHLCALLQRTQATF